MRKCSLQSCTNQAKINESVKSWQLSVSMSCKICCHLGCAILLFLAQGICTALHKSFVDLSQVWVVFLLLLVVCNSLCKQHGNIGGIPLFFGHIIRSIPRYILGFCDICDQFDIMVWSHAMHNGGTPIVDESICSFRCPFSVNINIVNTWDFKRCILFTAVPCLLQNKTGLLGTPVYLKCPDQLLFDCWLFYRIVGLSWIKRLWAWDILWSCEVGDVTCL